MVEKSTAEKTPIKTTKSRRGTAESATPKIDCRNRLFPRDSLTCDRRRSSGDLQIHHQRHWSCLLVLVLEVTVRQRVWFEARATLDTKHRPLSYSGGGKSKVSFAHILPSVMPQNASSEFKGKPYHQRAATEALVETQVAGARDVNL